MADEKIRITGGVLVEYVDLYKKAEGQELPVEGQFEEVVIHPNGWVECREVQHEDRGVDGNKTVDFIPRERVNQILAVEDQIED